ncbi:MAG: polysaccharide biosynthesis protein [Candidatus Kuenenia sp.]|nr:polysaccharide biosynthesis protein [Candidatus Kuenenia hertensis]
MTLAITEKKFVNKLFYPTYFKRTAFFCVWDIFIISFSLYASFLLRFDFVLSPQYTLMVLRSLPLFLCVKISMFVFFKIYKITWQYVSISDFLYITLSQIAALIVLGAIVWNSYLPDNIINSSGIYSLFPVHGFPRSIIFVDSLISLVLFCVSRISKRVFLKYIYGRITAKYGKRTIIIGAGNTGSMILRDLKEGGYEDYCPVGLFDDDVNKVGKSVHGIPVLGTTDKLEDVIKKNKVEAMVVAIPSLNYKALRIFYDIAKKHNVEIKIIPRIYDDREPSINVHNLENISIEDLLGRQAVEIDQKGIEEFIHNKVVLITGAGGSIGSEIAMQVCSFHPERVILFDIDETELHYMKLQLEKRFPHLLHNQRINSQMMQRVLFITGDIRDEESVTRVLENMKPQIVFHAAAYKHVPMMEYNAKEAVKVNMFGTYEVAKASVENNVEKFILISTDKAVRPTSIMGATKRMAEYICMAFDSTSNTEFLSVRFGNVLGSRGSVLPLFLQQLKEGGPLTVTHKEVTRYFMTIPEAVSLVLQAAILGKGGDILVLDMGEPVKLLTLAEDLIKIHGLRPYLDIDIKITGLRPGEKLYEEILTAEEGTTASVHKKIYFAKNSGRFSLHEINNILKDCKILLQNLSTMDHYEDIRDMLKKYIQHFERRRLQRSSNNNNGSMTLNLGKKRMGFSFLDEELEDAAKKYFNFSDIKDQQHYRFIIGFAEENRLYRDWETIHFRQNKIYCKASAETEKRIFFSHEGKPVILEYICRCIYEEFYNNVKNNGNSVNDFIVHAAGLVINKKGFLFVGESGAGKTTVANLFANQAEIISDELVIITNVEGKYFISQFPAKTELTKLNNKVVPLNAVFLLKQDKSTSLEKPEMKKLVITLFKNIYFSNDSNNINEKYIFSEKLRMISEIVSDVPIYEMRFTNDNSFLKNISALDHFKQEKIYSY